MDRPAFSTDLQPSEVLTDPCVGPRSPTSDGPLLVSGITDEPYVLNMPTTAELPLSAAPDVPIRDASRLLDLLLAAGIMIFVLPLMAFCALAVRLSGPGPVLFRQKRIGRGGAEFDCFKFRTMSHQADSRIEEILRHCQQSQEQWAALQKLTRDPRVTPIGRVLRRYCLDELPQLFNVLAGQMSIVGPRPIVASEILRYGPMFGHYCSVRPGLTGLWQVSGRHALSYDQRVQLDAEYAQSKCARLDLWILVRTVPVVLLGENE